MNETQQLEAYLNGEMSPENKLLMEVHLVLNEGLKDKLRWQEKTYTLIKESGRRQLKQEIENVHQRLFSEKKFESFRKKIQSIFK